MLTGQIRLIRAVIRLILSTLVIGASPTEKMPTDRDLQLSTLGCKKIEHSFPVTGS